jgi:CheY-like chemotaxis protein
VFGGGNIDQTGPLCSFVVIIGTISRCREPNQPSALDTLLRSMAARSAVWATPLAKSNGPYSADRLSIMSDSLRILVVEDEKALAHMIGMVVGGPSAKVTRARNGWEALIKVGVAPRPFDVVITDHRMPRMTGLELVRRLRAKNFGGKILVLSANLSDEVIHDYQELNVDMMMTKPFDFDELQDAMAVLNKKPSVLTAAAEAATR